MGLTYNTVDLSYTLTQRIDHESPKDPSGTDQTLTAIRISVQAVLNAAVAPATSPSETPAQQMVRIRHLLTAPRKPLTFSIGADNIIDLPGGLDDANGPFPDDRAFSITHVTAQTFIVTFAVTVRLIDCTGAASQRGWLSLRWEESATIGRDWLTTYRRQGTLVLSGRATTAPDGYRGLVTPTCPAGFRREEAEYVIGADGLTARFRFTDKEYMRPPPGPALRMRGHQIESTPLPGAVRYGEIELTLDGPRNVAASDLVRVAVRVATQNALAAGINVGEGRAAGRYLIGGSIRKSLADDENSVSVSIKWQTKAADVRLGGPAGKAVRGGAGFVLGYYAGLALTGNPVGAIAGAVTGAYQGYNQGEPVPPNKDGKATDALPVDMKWLDNPIAGSAPGVAIAPPTRGTAETLRLVAAALGDLCGQVAEVERRMDGADELVGTTPDGARVTARQLNAGDTEPDDFEALYSAEEDSPGVYSHFQCNLIYRDSSGTVVLPGTGVGDTPDKGVKVKIGGRSLTLTCEFAGTRVGGAVEIPSADTDDDWCYLGGSLNLSNLELAGDGVTVRHEVAGVWEFAALDPNKVRALAAVPPYLKAALLGGAAGEQSRSLSAPILGPVVNAGGHGAGGDWGATLTSGADPFPENPAFPGGLGDGGPSGWTYPGPVVGP